MTGALPPGSSGTLHWKMPPRILGQGFWGRLGLGVCGLEFRVWS